MSGFEQTQKETESNIRTKERKLERLGMQELLNEKRKATDSAVHSGTIPIEVGAAMKGILSALAGQVEQGLHRMDLAE